MCGVAGCVEFGGGLSELARDRIGVAVGKMRRRGPDGNGVVCGDGYIFGHARLAIIDPAHGRQPCMDESTGVVLTYNGEIYNFQELRRELEGKGHAFHTRCDTEVLLRAYLEWGQDCLERLQGFFAFAIFDPRVKKLFAARDRFGVKPFHYYFDGQRLYFASTVPALLAASGMRPEPDMAAVSNYLTTGRSSFGERTLLRGVTALQPGRCLVFSEANGVPAVRRYWRLPRLSEEEKRGAPPFDEAVEVVSALLDRAVAKRLISDVPLGAFLSGGLDSAIIVNSASAKLDFKLPLFCAGSDDEAMNEFKYAELVARQVESELECIRVDAGKFIDDWSLLIANKGMPLSTPNEVSIYHLARALKQKCTVTLTGEGADEIFGGYIQPHFSAFDFDRCPRSADEPADDSSFALAMTMLYGRSFFINDTDHYTATCAWMGYAERESLFDAGVWEALDADDGLFMFYEDYFANLEGLSSFDKRMHLHAEFNLESLLNRVDSSTMAASVEARVPFTDHELAEFAFTMPDCYKMWWNSPGDRALGASLTSADIDRRNLLTTKRLPRAAYSGRLPSEIIRRKKMSFPVPFEKWFYGDILGMVNDLCHSSDFARNHFKPDTLAKMFKHKNRNLWLVANLCSWWDSLKK